MHRVALEDFLLFAEGVLDVPAEALHHAADVGLAQSALAAPFAGVGDILFYEQPTIRAAVLCARIVANHPLPDGNKRTGLLCMLELLHRDGLRLTASQTEIAGSVESLAAHEITEADFIKWVERHVERL